MKEGFKEWIIRAGIRAIKTFAQTFLGFIVVGAAMSDIPWLYALSVSTVALIASLLTSIAGLPELKKSESDGKLVLDPDGNMANVEFEEFPEGASKITLDVVERTDEEVN